MKRFLMIVIVMASLSSITQSVRAQAYCALRDPVRQIGTMYPNHNYASHVGVVTTDVRKKVSASLPFTLHFNELGSHTLYDVFDGDVRRGYIHVRPEITRWGIMEMTWSLDTDLRVRDFAFQRCRNRRRTVLESDDFKKQLQGKSFEQLLALLNHDGTTLKEDSLQINALDAEFATAVIRCALKTIAVTQIVWEDKIKTSMLVPASSMLREVSTVYTPSVNQALETMSIANNADIERKTIRVFRVIDNSNKNQFLIETRWLAIKPAPLVRWYISEGMITNLSVSNQSPNKQIDDEFEQLIGKTLVELTDCKTTIDLTALEVLLICRELTPLE
ncbi:MAG: hypothetical protein HOB20_12365 [Planctomycetaceae bacterium]|jgi:hypothetical protein|nr:hypothetical protein [Planctomycetaceae bacterium]